MTLAVVTTPTGVRIDLRVIPKSPRTKIDGVRDGRLLVRVTAPPVDDAANDAVVETLARMLDVPKRSIRSSRARARETRRWKSGMTVRRYWRGFRSNMPGVTTLVIEHLDELWPVAGRAPRSGPDQGDHSPIFDGAIACAGATIVAVGSTAEVRHKAQPTAETKIIDGRGRSLVPGFVDGHTHVVYAGDRRDELRRRLAGATYAEIAAAGGGILSTVRATRSASEQELADQTRARSAKLAAGSTWWEPEWLRIESTRKSDAARHRGAKRRSPSGLPPRSWAPTRFRQVQGRQRDYVAGHRSNDSSHRPREWCDVFCDRGFSRRRSRLPSQPARATG